MYWNIFFKANFSELYKNILPRLCFLRSQLGRLHCVVGSRVQGWKFHRGSPEAVLCSKQRPAGTDSLGHICFGVCSWRHHHQQIEKRPQFPGNSSLLFIRILKWWIYASFNFWSSTSMFATFRANHQAAWAEQRQDSLCIITSHFFLLRQGRRRVI